jgi:adenylate kinase
MKLLIMGPPGAGKGTQAESLSETFGLAHLSSGDLLRVAVRQGTEVGKRAKAYMESGELVPDKVMIELILGEVLGLVESGKGFLLDGFPRTLEQAEALQQSFDANNIKIERVINLQASDDTVVSRLAGRRVCPVCNRIYHAAEFQIAKIAKCADHSETDLVIRSDDREDVVRQRLKVYQKNTEPIIGFYKKFGIVLDIDGSQDKQEITRLISGELQASLEA